MTELGATRRSMHTELVRRAHLPLLRSAHLDHINYGENQYLGVSDVVELSTCPLTGTSRPCPRCCKARPEQIQAAYRQAVADGAPEMMPS